MPPPELQYCLISNEEAELIAFFRTMSEPAQQAIASMVASQAGTARQDVAKYGKLSLVMET